MKSFAKLAGATSIAVLASAVAASAAMIDFTDDATGFSGSIGDIDWELTGTPVDPNTNEAGGGREIVGELGTIAWDNDGVGIGDDEVSAGTDPVEFLTLTFSEAVTLTGVFFLDLFIAQDTETLETAHITVGDMPGAANASIDSNVVFPTMGGFREAEISLTGTTFTFFADPGNDDIGVADFALAAVTVAPVPLPAGMLLMGTALGGLGLARRRKQRNA